MEQRNRRYLGGIGSWRYRNWLRSMAVLAIVPAIAACSKTVTWKEAVKLSTGQIVDVHRETYHRPGGAELAVGSGWRPTKYTIRFEYPLGSGRTIEWHSTKMDVERGTEPEFPLVLDVDASRNIPYIVTFRGLRGFCYEYVRYVYMNNAWVEDPLPDRFRPYATNLYLSAAGLDLPNHVTLDRKRRENSDPRYPPDMKQVGPKRMECSA